MNELLAKKTTLLPFEGFGESAETNADQTLIRFGIATDSHYADKLSFELKHYRDGLDKMRLFIEIMNREQVNFIVHLGDLKDEDQTRTPSNTKKYLQEIAEVIRQFRGPTFHCVGNHDLDSITKREFLTGVDNSGIPPERSFYSFDAAGFRFIVLDPNFDESGKDLCFKEGGHWEDTRIHDDQMRWLQTELANSRLPVMVFCHQLLFELVMEPYRYHVNNYLEVRDLLESSGKVIAVFHGHAHQEIFKRINGIHYIVRPAMLEYPGRQNTNFTLVEIQPRLLLIHGFQGPGHELKQI